jgi:polyisoprenoid-binding protein YceI
MAAIGASAAPVTYEFDPMHTYPSFEGDHMGGLSVWRGKMTRTTGSVTLDRAAGTGSVEVLIDANSIDFGLPAMHDHAIAPDFLDTAKYPQITYKGKLAGFTDGKPSRVEGELTLHGVTKPVVLQIQSFKCIQHPMYKREVCGADAIGTFKRDEFGLAMGKDWGFGMDVTVRVQVEALAKP